MASRSPKLPSTGPCKQLQQVKGMAHIVAAHRPVVRMQRIALVRLSQVIMIRRECNEAFEAEATFSDEAVIAKNASHANCIHVLEDVRQILEMYYLPTGTLSIYTQSTNAQPTIEIDTTASTQLSYRQVSWHEVDVPEADIVTEINASRAKSQPVGSKEASAGVYTG